MKTINMVTLILLLTSVFAMAVEFPDLEMTGHWIGQCKIMVSWCEQESLQVDIEINQAGSVMGRIGDAKIASGKLVRNDMIMRLLGNTDYIIHTNLEGNLVAAEGIKRDEAKLLLDFKDGGFEGELHSSGSKFGGKEQMMMTAINLKLFKK